jgi:hypothetical protein
MLVVDSYKQDRQCTYNVTLQRFRVTIVAVITVHSLCVVKWLCQQYRNTEWGTKILLQRICFTDNNKTHLGLHVKCPIFFVRFWPDLGVLGQDFLQVSYICPLGTRWCLWTDVTKVIGAFRDYLKNVCTVLFAGLSSHRGGWSLYSCARHKITAITICYSEVRLRELRWPDVLVGVDVAAGGPAWWTVYWHRTR